MPEPTFPSNAKKFISGGSLAASALSASCASTPPTTAQIGANSVCAVAHSDLDSVSDTSQKKKKGANSLNQGSRDAREGRSVDPGGAQHVVTDRLEIVRGTTMGQPSSLVERLILP